MLGEAGTGVGEGAEVARGGSVEEGREGELGEEKEMERGGDGGAAVLRRRRRWLGDGCVAKVDRQRGVAAAT